MTLYDGFIIVVKKLTGNVKFGISAFLFSVFFSAVVLLKTQWPGVYFFVSLSVKLLAAIIVGKTVLVAIWICRSITDDVVKPVIKKIYHTKKDKAA